VQDENAARYAVGPFVVVMCALAYNAYATRVGRPTVSSSIRWLRRHPFGAWIAGGVIGGLIAHWFLDSEVPLGPA